RQPGLERRAVDEGLEGRAGLTLSLRDMVVLIDVEVAAADPGLDLAARRLDRDEAGLEPRLLALQPRRPCAVGRQRVQCSGVGRARVSRTLVLGRLANEVGDQVAARAPEVAERGGLGVQRGVRLEAARARPGRRAPLDG